MSREPGHAARQQPYQQYQKRDKHGDIDGAVVQCGQPGRRVLARGRDVEEAGGRLIGDLVIADPRFGPEHSVFAQHPDHQCPRRCRVEAEARIGAQHHRLFEIGNSGSETRLHIAVAKRDGQAVLSGGDPIRFGVAREVVVHQAMVAVGEHQNRLLVRAHGSRDRFHGLRAEDGASHARRTDIHHPQVQIQPLGVGLDVGIVVLPEAAGEGRLDFRVGNPEPPGNALVDQRFPVQRLVMVGQGPRGGAPGDALHAFARHRQRRRQNGLVGDANAGRRLGDAVDVGMGGARPPRPAACRCSP